MLVGLWACNCNALAQERADEPPGSTHPPPQPASPRDLLEPLGIGASFFSEFADDRALEPLEREKLLLLIYRLRRLGPRTMEEFSQRPREIGLIEESPGEFRGDVFWVPCLVRYAVREELGPELREKFQFDSLYRCQAATLLGAQVTLYTSSIPSAWKTDRPIEEYGGARGMFVKVLAISASDDPTAESDRSEDRGAASRSLLFVAPRVTWYPRTLLGRLRMDVGLFDDVRDRSPLDERECFYQLLAAVRRADDGQIERSGRQELAERRDFLERLARNRELGPKAHAAAERALARAEENADDVVPLFNDPAGQRGKLFVLSGEALRAVEVRVDDPDIRERFDIDHYYEVDIVTPDSENNPIVCDVAKLPPQMPLGESIHQNVRVTGYFLKSWAFDSRKSADPRSPTGEKNRRQLAPLLIAKTVQVLKPPEFGLPSTSLIVGLLVAVFVCAALMWQVRRGDRQALAKAAGNEPSLPPRIALDNLDLDSGESTANGP